MATHFELFGLLPAFDLDRKILDERYRQFSQQWHPDKFAGADAKARLKAADMTVAMNEAYKVLREPSLRAAYLLKQLGLDLDEEGERTFQMDPFFLMTMLELREELEEAGKKNDVPRALEMGKQMAEREQQAHESLLALFAAQLTKPEPGRLQKLADQVAALRYYRRFLDEVSAIEEKSLG